MKLFRLICAAVFLLWGMAFAELPERPDEKRLIFDFAGLLEEQDEKNLEENGQLLWETGKAEVVLITLDSLEGRPIAEVSLELARSWKIGSAAKDNGILVLVIKDNLLAGKKGKARLEVGTRLQGVMPDSRAGELLRENAVPSWDDGQYVTGISMLYFSITSYLDEKLDEEGNPNEAVEEVGEGQSSSGSNVGFLMFVLIFGGLFVWVCWCIFRPRGRHHRGGDDDDYYDSGNDSGDSGSSDDGGGDFDGGGADV